jgi:hypothetical protein
MYDMSKITLNRGSYQTNKILAFTIALLLSCFITKAQNYFRYPLDSLPHFVSPFGGLRDNHFHSGIDLKTNEREGLPVYACADGYISRIKIQSIGYGKAIYIDHPNGHTTVYGHLQKYHGKIAEWIHAYQYKNQSFEFDKVFEKPLLFVKKGDTIGFSGNSGGSTGPHLHFEIRNTKSEEIINPALFGIIPFDTLCPTIQKLCFYKFTTEAAVMYKEIDLTSKKLIKSDSIWILKDTLQLENNYLGMGIETYDYIHNASDRKNIYLYETYMDGKNTFAFTLNQFAFDQSKYINAHIDYDYYKRNQVRIQKCFVDDGNEIPLYTYEKNKGRITLLDDKIHEVKIRVLDASGNATILLFYVVLKKSVQEAKHAKKTKAFYPLKANDIKQKEFAFHLDARSIYDTIFYVCKVLPKIKKAYSKTYQIHHSSVPLHKAADISIKVEKVKKEYQDKLLLAYFDKNEKKFRSAGGAYENGFVKGKASVFGSYFVSIDTLAPIVERVFIDKENPSVDTLYWHFQVKDNFSGIGKYEAYLNNHWILLDYDAKSNLLSYKFDEVYFDFLVENMKRLNQNLPVVKPELLLRVNDKKGNLTEYKVSINL